MVKYDLAFKLRTVEAYLAGEGGYLMIAKKYGTRSKSDIQKWVRLYLKLGFSTDLGCFYLKDDNKPFKNSK